MLLTDILFSGCIFNTEKHVIYLIVGDKIVLLGHLDWLKLFPSFSKTWSCTLVFYFLCYSLIFDSKNHQIITFDGYKCTGNCRNMTEMSQIFCLGCGLCVNTSQQSWSRVTSGLKRSDVIYCTDVPHIRTNVDIHIQTSTKNGFIHW